MPDIQSWTSLGMGWGDLRGKPLWPYGEAIRLALLERLAPANASPPPILASPLNLYTPPSAAWGQAFDTALTDLIPRYLNHTSTIVGASSISTWTESAILTAAGYASRYAVSAGAMLSAGWLKQQYDLINLLRWREHTTSSMTSDVRTGYDATSWAAAVADFNGNSWITDSEAAQHIATGGADYQVNRLRNEVTINGLPGTSFDIVVYAKFDGGDTYSNPDYPTFALNQYGQLYAATGGTSHTVQIGYFDTVTLGSPPSGSLGWRLHDYRIILKHNVAGGLAFIA